MRIDLILLPMIAGFLSAAGPALFPASESEAPARTGATRRADPAARGAGLSLRAGDTGGVPAPDPQSGDLASSGGHSTTRRPVSAIARSGDRASRATGERQPETLLPRLYLLLAVLALAGAFVLAGDFILLGVLQLIDILAAAANIIGTLASLIHDTIWEPAVDLLSRSGVAPRPDPGAALL